MNRNSSLSQSTNLLILIQPLLFVNNLFLLLDKFITYRVHSHKTLYQVSPVVWTNCITTRHFRVNTTDNQIFYE